MDDLSKTTASELFTWHLESVADEYSDLEARESFRDWLQVFRYKSAFNINLVAAAQLFHENNLAMQLINQYKEINHEDK
jgi:hypothetical protein